MGSSNVKILPATDEIQKMVDLKKDSIAEEHGDCKSFKAVSYVYEERLPGCDVRQGIPCKKWLIKVEIDTNKYRLMCIYIPTECKGYSNFPAETHLWPFNGNSDFAKY